MLRKKEVYTHITPIPSHVPRQLALDILHSHSEIITLNPLVLDHKPIPAPRNAEADEFYSTWYEIFERIQYVPGTGKLGSGKISFRGCFHDMPWGLQTHIYAPAGVDMRNKWRICGNQPGEPPEGFELGINAPREGLYLREDIEIKCNFTLVSFVKSQMKASSKVLVDRLIKKAELLDAGVLQAMMENGRLKTINPADRSKGDPLPSSSARISQHNELPPPPGSPSPYQVPQNPYAQRHTMNGLPQHYSYQQEPQQQQHEQQAPMELPGDQYFPQTSPTPSYLHPQYSPNSQYANPQYSPNMRPVSTASSYSPSAYTADGRPWSDYHSQSSRPTSYASDTGGFRSPGLEQKGFAAELPVMKESREEHDLHHADALQKLEQNKPLPPLHHHHQQQQQQQHQRYNPADYAQVHRSSAKINDY